MKPYLEVRFTKVVELKKIFKWGLIQYDYILRRGRDTKRTSTKWGNNLHAKERGFRRNQASCTLILDFQPPKLWNYKFLFLSHQLHAVFCWWQPSKVATIFYLLYKYPINLINTISCLFPYTEKQFLFFCTEQTI